MKLGNRRRNLMLGLVIATSLVGACSQEQPDTAERLRPVRWQTAYVAGATRVRTFAGIAQAGQESQLSFKVAGSVSRVAVKAGDQVAAGALIADLDTQDLRLKFEEAEATLRSQEATERNARANLERTERLYENDNIAVSDLETARTQHLTAQAAVRSATSALEIARRQLGYGVLRAPLAGRIAQVTVESGENVTAGQAVAVLNAGDRPEVRVAIPEVLIAQVRDGDKVTVAFDAIPARTFAAVVTELGVSTAAATTYPVTVTLDDVDPGIRAGMAAEVSFTFGSGGGGTAIVVPSVAVGEDVGGRHVFVVRDVASGQGTVHRVDVQTGDLTSAGIEIVAGLADGDIVVTAGVHKLADGARVLVPDAAGGE